MNRFPVENIDKVAEAEKADSAIISETASEVEVANKATSDSNGNNIISTYATKSEISNFITSSELSSYATKDQLSSYTTTTVNNNNITKLSISGNTVTYTKANNTTDTITLPASSDVNVTQTASTTSEELPILGKGTTATSTVTGTVKFGSSVTLNPSSGAITSKLIKTNNSFETNVAVSGTSIDVSTGSVFTKTISAATTFTFTGAVSSKVTTFSLILTNGGSKTVTWPSSVKWANDEVPELTTSGVDVITFMTNNGGTTWYGTSSILNAK